LASDINPHFRGCAGAVARLSRRALVQLINGYPHIEPSLTVGLLHRAHSYLSATNGSTFIARRAGIEHANKAATASSNGTNKKVRGSTAFTSKSNEVISLVKANDAARPMEIPSSVNPIPLFTIINRMFRAVAPRASRTPISFVC